MGIKLKYRATWDAQSKGFRFIESEIRRLGAELPVFNGRELDIEIKLYSPPKTQKQLGYYFSGIIPFIRDLMIEAGYEPISDKIVRDFLEQRFIRREFYNEKTAEVMDYAGSIADLTTEEMREYLNAVNAFCLEWFNCPIPEPLKRNS